MPKGPKGQKRPADVIGCAVMVAKIATGEIVEEISAKRKGGLKGSKARADKLSPERKSEIAKAAAAARWKKSK